MKKIIFIAIITVVAKLLKFGFEIGTSFFVSDEVYGSFSILISYVLIFTRIGAFGIPNLLIRDYPKYCTLEERSLLLQNSLLIVVIVSFFLYGIIYFFDINYLNEYLVIPLIVFLSSSIIVTSAYIRSIGETVSWIFFKDILWYLFYFIGLFALYYLGSSNYNIDQILSIYTLSIFLSFICLFLLIKYKYGFLFFGKFSYNKIKEIGNESFPVLFTGLTYLILARIDVIMLGDFVDKSLVGQYNKVVRITVQVLFFHQVIASYFLPKLAKKFVEKKDFDDISLYNTKFMILSVFSVLFTALLLYFGVKEFKLFHLLKIPETDELMKVFYIFLISQVLYVMMSSYSYILLYIHKQKIEYLNNVIILFTGICLNYLLIIRFGIIGAAFSSAFAILLGGFFEMIQVKYYTKTFFLKI